MSKPNGRSCNGNGNKQFVNPRTLEQQLKCEKETAAIFSADPSRIARAWATAQMPGVNPEACIALIEKALAKLDPDVVQEFVYDHLFCEARYGGVWPQCFFEQAGLQSFGAIVNTSLLGGEVGTYGTLFCLFFAHNLNWTRILNKAFDEDEQEVLGDILGDMLGICASARLLPVPGGVHYLGESVRPTDQQLVVPVPCWQGTTEMSVMEWNVPPDVFHVAKAFIDSFLREMRPDPQYAKMIRSARERYPQILAETEAKWKDIRSVAEGKPVPGFRHWIVGKGLTHLWVELRDGDYVREIGPIILTPEGKFPGMVVEIPWDVCEATGVRVREENHLDPQSGLIFDPANFEACPDEVATHALVNQALVNALHRHAFSALYPKPKSKSGRGDAEEREANGRVGRAVAPSFFWLPNGHNRSATALDRAVDMMGGQMPPDGQSFRATPATPRRVRQEDGTIVEVEPTIPVLPMELRGGVEV